jgi:phytanoyl-CoA hydroxylase
MNMMTEMAATYRRDGYAVARGIFDPQAVADCIAEATRICREDAGSIGGWAGAPIAGSDAFATMNDDDLLGRILAIQFINKLSPVFKQAVFHDGLVDILGHLVGPNVKCVQSILFIKQSGKPGQAWHQDEHFIPTRDRSLIGAWVALDRATAENGCLRVLPGSHASGILYPTRPHGRDDYDGAPEAFGYDQHEADEVVAEMAPGDILFFNGYVLHRSTRNMAPAGTYRRALVNHYMSAESLLPWDIGGMIAPTQDNRDIVMVRGHDPYAWKGIEQNSRPYIRTDESWG